MIVSRCTILSMLLVAFAATCTLATNNPSTYRDPRLVGGDGVVFKFKGRKDRDFCLVSDPSLHLNAQFIGKHARPRPLTWLGSLAFMFAHHQLLVTTFQEPSWDPFSDYLVIKYDGQDLHLPAPGFKSSPQTPPSIWETEIEFPPTRRNITSASSKRDGKSMQAADADQDRPHVRLLRITRRRVNEARVEIVGMLDLRLTAGAAAQELWGEDTCYPHLDMEFRELRLSPLVHGVLGQTYRPARLRAARARSMVVDASDANVNSVDRAVLGSKNSAIVGRVDDYITSGLWASDCKFSKFVPGMPSSSGHQQEEMTKERKRRREEVNPLEAYFGDTAVRIVRRSQVTSSLTGDKDSLTLTSLSNSASSNPSSTTVPGVPGDEDEGSAGDGGSLMWDHSPSVDDGYVIAVDSDMAGSTQQDSANDADLQAILGEKSLIDLMSQ